MDLEFTCSQNGVAIKKITIRTHKDKTMVQILELRENYLGKSGWIPIFFRIYDTFEEARAIFIGLISQISYECANSTTETDRENLFIRGSLPISNGRKIPQA